MYYVLQHLPIVPKHASSSRQKSQQLRQSVVFGGSGQPAPASPLQPPSDSGARTAPASLGRGSTPGLQQQLLREDSGASHPVVGGEDDDYATDASTALDYSSGPAFMAGAYGWPCWCSNMMSAYDALWVALTNHARQWSWVRSDPRACLQAALAAVGPCSTAPPPPAPPPCTAGSIATSRSDAGSGGPARSGSSGQPVSAVVHTVYMDNAYMELDHGRWVRLVGHGRPGGGG